MEERTAPRGRQELCFEPKRIVVPIRKDSNGGVSEKERAISCELLHVELSYYRDMIGRPHPSRSLAPCFAPNRATRCTTTGQRGVVQVRGAGSTRTFSEADTFCEL
jgi:hypothetical protein